MGTIFYKIVPSYENPVTEVLCNLFQYKNIRDVFLRFFNIPTEVIETIKYEHIDTQKVKANTGIPDIVIENSQVLIYLENKVHQNADLQGTQKKHYLDNLEKAKSEKRYIRMIYLVPKSYSHLEEILEAISNKNYAKTYLWENFIKHMEDNDLHRTNLLVAEFINHYRNLFIQETFTTALNTKEMELLLHPKVFKEANSLISKLTQIMTGVNEILMRKYIDRISLEWSKDGDEYWHDQNEKGVYIRLDGDFLIFYGLWFGFFNENPSLSDYLFCMASGNDEGYEVKPEHLIKFRSLSDVKNTEDQTWYVAKFPDFTISDEDVIQKIASVLIETMTIMTQSE